MTVVEPGGLWGPLSDALAGGSVVAPAADAATVAMLRPDVPVAEPDAALIVATAGPVPGTARCPPRMWLA